MLMPRTGRGCMYGLGGVEGELGALPGQGMPTAVRVGMPWPMCIKTGGLLPYALIPKACFCKQKHGTQGRELCGVVWCLWIDFCHYMLRCADYFGGGQMT
jgi:hypothetical protein